MKKTLILFGICLLFASNINAQQMALNSQYLYNDFAINPAVAEHAAPTKRAMAVLIPSAE